MDAVAMDPDLPPPLPSPLVHRPRLLERVDAGVRGPLTIVSGPPGCGKTTLLAEWAHARSAAGDPGVRWHSVASGEEAGRLLSELAQEPPPAGGQPLVAILDGFATPSPTAAPALAAHVSALVRGDRERLRVVLSTRGEPPLPLARVRLDAAVQELGPDELAFTWEEARELLEPALEADAAHARWEQVEGWAAGLAHDAIALDAFIERELLAELDPRLRDFLLRVSVAEELTPALAAELTGAPDAGATLDALARAHALVVPLDRHGGAYRLARPLRDLLRDALPAALPGTVERLHRRAADWHAGRGEPLAAARHALAAADPRRAGELLADSWLDLLTRGHEAEMAELLVALGPAAVADDPQLRLAAGALATARSSVAQALDRHLDEDEPPRGMRATLAAARLRLARLEGDLAGASTAAAELTAAGGDATAQRRRRALAVQQLGFTALVAGDGDAAAAHLQQALGISERAGFTRLAVTTLGVLSGLDAHRGRLRSAAAWGERARALAADSDEQRPAALLPADLGLAVVAWCRDDLPAAAAAFARAEEGLAAASYAAPPDALSTLAVRIVAAWLAAGGAPGAGDAEAELARLELTAQAARTALDRLPDGVALALDEARVRLLLALERPREAAAAASAPHTAFRPERLLLGARVALAREDGPEAQRLADRFLARAGADVRPVYMLEGMLVQAATSCELSTVWDGLTWLERAIAAAAEERCLRPFREGGRPVRALLQVLARRGPWPPVGFVAELLDDGPAAGPAAPLPGTSPLSERERAILRYLPSRLSKREIAGELGVSANTVKTHVSSIYRKLDVGSRAEAIARARALGLLGSGLGGAR